MARLPMVPETEVPTEMRTAYRKVSQGETSLPNTFHAMFASPGVGRQLVDLDALVSYQTDLEPWAGGDPPIRGRRSRRCSFHDYLLRNDGPAEPGF